MTSPCDPSTLLLGLIIAPIGAIFLYLGIAAWRSPNSALVQSVLVNIVPTHDEADPISRFFGFTREKAGPSRVRIFRILGPLNGSVFFCFGLWMIISHIGCAPRWLDLRPLFGALEFTFWPPMIPFVVFAGLIGVMNAWRMSPGYRELTVLLFLAFGFAATEAAAYHVGMQSKRWFLVAMSVLALASLVWWLNSRQSREDDQQGAS